MCVGYLKLLRDFIQENLTVWGLWSPLLRKDDWNYYLNMLKHLFKTNADKCIVPLGHN